MELMLLHNKAILSGGAIYPNQIADLFQRT